jgi:hypothetical protein
LATSNNLFAKSTMFPHRNIHKHTWTSPERKTHSQIDHILIDRRRHSSGLDVRCFRAVDCDTDSYLIVAKVSEQTSCTEDGLEQGVHCCVHKNQKLVPILSQNNSTEILILYFYKIHFNIILLYTPRSSMWSFPCSFHLLHACYTSERLII